MIAGNADMVIERSLEANAPTLSVRIVKFDVPVEDGVPLMAPEAGVNTNPAGSTPVVTAQLMAGVPPLMITAEE